MTRYFSLLIATSLLFVGWIASSAPSQEAANKVTGWRGDGTGRFTDAKPPIKWSKDSENILWKIELEKGYSSPVLGIGEAKDKLFLTTDASELVCINADNGEVLWRQTADYTAALGEKEAARITAEHERLDAARREAGKAYEEARKENPDSPETARLKDLRQEADAARRAFEDKFPPLRRGGAGSGAATVTCDGENVYAVFGTGIVAAYTVEGKQLWIKHLGAPPQGFGHSASPLLADGRLIVHVENLQALDPATGSQKWLLDLPAKFGTPAVAKVSDKEEIVITPSGAVVNAATGKLLAEDQFRMSHNSPVVNEDVVYIHEEGKVKAFKLPKEIGETFEWELLWETNSSRDQRMASAVVHDGLIYACGRRGIMDVFDVSDGKLAYRERLDIGEMFSSPVLAGDYLFFAGRDGRTAVLKPGPKYAEVAVNESERISTIPLFAGERMYLRTDKHLICVGK